MLNQVECFLDDIDLEHGKYDILLPNFYQYCVIYFHQTLTLPVEDFMSCASS